MSAPVVIVVCGNAKRTVSKEFAKTDATICASYLQLAAADKGLGTVWIGGFVPALVKKVLGLPDHIIPVTIIPLGYPSDKGHRKDRQPLSKVLHRENW
jgi:nitroreductase